jgi:tripartite-type tricarboxylate transporter receptor subunit TctC
MEALGQPTVRQTLDQQGLEWVGSTSAEFEAFIAAEGRRWSELVIEQKLTLG